MGFFDNTRKPMKLTGQIMVKLMNYGHRDISEWGLSHLKIDKDAKVIDIGCGGGANIDRLLKMCPEGKIMGIDYSEVSVKSSRRRNRRCVRRGQCHIIEGNVANLPFEDRTFDAATAFETIYFWPDIVDSFKEVLRVLKPNGKFLIKRLSHTRDFSRE